MTDQSSQSDKGSHGNQILNSCLITALGTTLITVGFPEILKHFGRQNLMHKILVQE